MGHHYNKIIYRYIQVFQDKVKILFKIYAQLCINLWTESTEIQQKC